MEITRSPTRQTGTRTELVQELLRLAEGWQHFGNQRLYEASMAGADRLRLQAADSVRVGHTDYCVTDPTD